VSLGDLRGQVVLLDVWASWCPPCAVAFPNYDALYKQYRTRGLHVLAVNVDEHRRDASIFLEGRPHDVQVVWDPTGIAPKALKMKGMPTTYLIDRNGRIRFTHEGFSEKALPSYRREIEQLLQEAASAGTGGQ
jgi:thiol-disulfide isomerase/thioredoxin